MNENEIEKIKDIIEDLYDIMILSPINELELYYKSFRRLFKILNYPMNNIQVINDIIKYIQDNHNEYHLKKLRQ